MNKSHHHLFSRRKGLDKGLKADIRFREGSFVKPETIRGAWQSGAVADSGHLLLVSETLCYHASICLPRRLEQVDLSMDAAQSTPVCPNYTASKQTFALGHVNFPAPSLQSLADQSGNSLTGEQRLSSFNSRWCAFLRVARLRPL